MMNNLNYSCKVEEIINVNNEYALSYSTEEKLTNKQNNVKDKYLQVHSKTLSHKTKNNNKEIPIIKSNNQVEYEEQQETQKPYNSIIMPQIKTQQDYKEIKSFFWILYVIIYGIEDYRLIQPKQYFSKEQELRYMLVKKIQKMPSEKVDYLKAHKIKVQNMIRELGNGNKLSLNTFIGINIILKQNVCLVKNCVAQIYLNNNNDNENDVWCIDVNKEKILYGNIRNKECGNRYYLVENIIKPFKSISAYKVDDLRKICDKLDIDTKNNSNKNKTKIQLYQELIDKIEI